MHSSIAVLQNRWFNSTWMDIIMGKRGKALIQSHGRSDVQYDHFPSAQHNFTTCSWLQIIHTGFHTNKNQLLRVSSWMMQSISSSTRCSWVCELCWSEIRSPTNFQLQVHSKDRNDEMTHAIINWSWVSFTGQVICIHSIPWICILDLGGYTVYYY